MARIKHTKERASHYRFGGTSGVTFPTGVREIDVDDDRASWAVQTFDDVEYASQATNGYDAGAETVEENDRSLVDDSATSDVDRSSETETETADDSESDDSEGDDTDDSEDDDSESDADGETGVRATRRLSDALSNVRRDGDGDSVE